MTTNIILIAYGLFLILGGFFGFKKGSKISLIMGLVSGVLVLVGVWLLTFTPRVAWIFLTCLNTLLSVVFLLRLCKTIKSAKSKQLGLLPSGMLLLIALAVLIFCLTKII
jgi:uncharacterized membrane protein (UPF0136 family)